MPIKSNAACALTQAAGLGQEQTIYMTILQENPSVVKGEFDLSTQMHNALAAGVSLVPVGDDKRPTIKWKEFQTTPASPKVLTSWLKNHIAFAAVCGAVSGGLGILDFDDNPDYPASATFDAWFAKCSKYVELYDLPIQRYRSNWPRHRR